MTQRAGTHRAPVVVKVGSSSVTFPEGGVDHTAIGRLASEIASLQRTRDVVVVSSGAIAAGWAALARAGPRPSDPSTLQALSSAGQPRLMDAWAEGFARDGLVAGQVLLAPLDFFDRRQYLNARRTLLRLFDLGVVPVVNENDPVADEEIRFGDNDRLSALVAHLVQAEALVLLTDTPGLFTADPRIVEGASLIEEVVEIDHQLEAVAGGPGTIVGSGGMLSKLAAAKIATWSGVSAVIAEAARPGVLSAALAGEPGAGTVFRPRSRRLPARKLWIAFACRAAGALVVDGGARNALAKAGSSLLAAGVVGVRGDFAVDDAVEIEDGRGEVFAKGLVSVASIGAAGWIGRRTDELPEGAAPEVVHRDNLILLT